MTPSIVWLDRCESTMIEAARLADAGAAHGSAVIADEQTAGQGRLGRKWHSEPHAGLYVSFVLRVEDAGVLTLALGLAAAEAIERTAGIACDLRWPNDVLIGGKKCAGILVNAEPGACIAGIGINVNHTSFPPELARLATSLRIASGREHSREALFNALADAVVRWTAQGREAVLQHFTRASSYVKGKRVAVEGIGIGTTDGLDPAGFLWLRADDGTRKLVVAGGVREV